MEMREDMKSLLFQLYYFMFDVYSLLLKSEELGEGIQDGKLASDWPGCGSSNITVW